MTSPAPSGGAGAFTPAEALAAGCEVASPVATLELDGVTLASLELPPEAIPSGAQIRIDASGAWLGGAGTPDERFAAMRAASADVGPLLWLIDGRAPMPEVARVTAAALAAGYTDARLLVRATAGGAPEPDPTYSASLRAALGAAPDAAARAALITEAAAALRGACPSLGGALEGEVAFEGGARCAETAAALSEALGGCDEATARRAVALHLLSNAAPEDQRFAQIQLTLTDGVRPLTVRPTATWAEASAAAAARRGGRAPGTLVMIAP